MTITENPFAGQGPVLLDIGGEVGALIVAMPAETLGLDGSSGSTAGLSSRVLAWLFWLSMLKVVMRELVAS